MTEATLEARMTVSSVTHRASTDRRGEPIVTDEIHLHPVLGPENEPWSSFTPSGRLELTLTNPNVCGRVKPGERYRVLLVPVEEGDAR